MNCNVNINVNMDSVKIIGIKDIEECRRLCNGWLSSKEPLAVDAEGIRLGAQGRLTLLQVATVNGKVYLFDFINPDDFSDENAGKRLLLEAGVKEVLESNDIPKIIHSCKNDCGALYHQFGISVDNVFDTVVADLTLQFAAGSLFPIHKHIDELIETYLQTTLTKRSIKDILLDDKDYWSRRPLTPDAIEYASCYVLILHRLYEIMNRKLNLYPSMENLYRTYLDIESKGQIETERTKATWNEIRKDTLYQFWAELNSTATVKSTPEPRVSENESRAVTQYFMLKSAGVVTEKPPPQFECLIKRLHREVMSDFSRVERDDKGYNRDYYTQVYLLSKYSDGKIRSDMKKLNRNLKVLKAKTGIEELIDEINSDKVANLSDLDSKGLNSLERYREFHGELFRNGYIERNRTLQHLEWQLNQQQIEHWESQDANGTFRENITIQVEMILKTIQKRDRDLKDRATNLLHKINKYKLVTI